jgi:hypothetical protein
MHGTTINIIDSKSFVLIILFINLNDFMGRDPLWVLAVELNAKHDMLWQVKLDACTISYNTQLPTNIPITTDSSLEEL